MRPTKAIFLRAAEIIEARGHCYGKFEDRDGQCCVAGAVLIAGYGYVPLGIGDAAGELLDGFGAVRPYNLNDTLTQAEATAWLRQIAETLP